VEWAAAAAAVARVAVAVAAVACSQEGAVAARVEAAVVSSLARLVVRGTVAASSSTTAHQVEVEACIMVVGGGEWSVGTTYSEGIKCPVRVKRQLFIITELEALDLRFKSFMMTDL
jgi:uncharacterized protein YhfF